MGGDYVLIGWLVLDATQSSSWVGIAFALYYLPNIIFGLIGGGIADRFPRRGLLQSLDFGAAGLIILFSVLFVYQTPQAPLVSCPVPRSVPERGVLAGSDKRTVLKTG
jgi:MFS family permease